MNRVTVSSTPILRAVLIWGAVVGVTVVIGSAVVGAVVAGGTGAASGALGALVGIVFPLLTAASILFANRWYGSPAYLQVFFGIVLGGWLVKFVVFLIALLVLSRLEWVVPLVFFFALIVAAVGSLVVDLVVLSRMRLPAVSDAVLPETLPEEATGDGEAPGV